MKPQSITAVIPVRNEARNLPLVLDEVVKYVDDILIIDGHSTDGTAEIARARGLRVVSDNGKGKGAALRMAREHARGEIIVFIDADCSHNPHDIPLLLEPILNGDADHVSGSRMLGGSDELFSSTSEFFRLVGSEIITLAIGKRFGVRLTDSQNGFRCIRKSVLAELDLQENITTIEQEMVVETLRRGYRLVERPTHEFRRKYGVSSINIWKVGFRYVFCLLRNLIKPQLAPVPAHLALIQQKYDSRWMSNEQHHTLPTAEGKRARPIRAAALG